MTGVLYYSTFQCYCCKKLQLIEIGHWCFQVITHMQLLPCRRKGKSKSASAFSVRVSFISVFVNFVISIFSMAVVDTLTNASLPTCQVYVLNFIGVWSFCLFFFTFSLCSFKLSFLNLSYQEFSCKFLKHVFGNKYYFEFHFVVFIGTLSS